MIQVQDNEKIKSVYVPKTNIFHSILNNSNIIFKFCLMLVFNNF